MPWIDHLLMKVSCRKFARHVSGEQPIPGGAAMRMFFWLHWMVCPFCRRYWREIREMGRLHRTLTALSGHPAIEIPHIKKRLKSALRQRYQ